MDSENQIIKEQIEELRFELIKFRNHINILIDDVTILQERVQRVSGKAA